MQASLTDRSDIFIDDQVELRGCTTNENQFPCARVLITFPGSSALRKRIHKYLRVRDKRRTDAPWFLDKYNTIAIWNYLTYYYCDCSAIIINS